MDNSTLDRRKKELEGTLKGKLRCYVTVGWMKEGEKAIFVVYYDHRAAVPNGAIPSKWYGCNVKHQGVLPPGVRPAQVPDDYFGAAW